MTRSWKTTAAGAGALLTTIGYIINQLTDGNAFTNPDWPVVIPAICSGLIGLFARDNNVTSEQAGAKPTVTETKP